MNGKGEGQNYDEVVLIGGCEKRESVIHDYDELVHDL